MAILPAPRLHDGDRRRDLVAPLLRDHRRPARDRPARRGRGDRADAQLRAAGARPRARWRSRRSASSSTAASSPTTAFNGAAFTAPDGQQVRLLEARTFSPPGPRRAHPARLVRGVRAAGLGQSRRRRARYWERLGFVTAAEGEEPWPHLSLTSHTLNIGLLPDARAAAADAGVQPRGRRRAARAARRGRRRAGDAAAALARPATRTCCWSRRRARGCWSGRRRPEGSDGAREARLVGDRRRPSAAARRTPSRRCASAAARRGVSRMRPALAARRGRRPRAACSRSSSRRNAPRSGCRGAARSPRSRVAVRTSSAG